MSPVIREIQVKGIITKTDIPVCDYAVNPYVGCSHGCRYCYASFMKRFSKHSEPWGEFLDVKYWPQIRNPEKYSGKEFFFGTVTDPYNPQEEKYCRTRSLLEELSGSSVKITIQTKSDLVLRDLDLIRAFPEARVGFSINTLDEEFRSDMDKAVSIERRLQAMKALHDAGVRTTCFISPIFPGLTNVFSIIERVEGICQLVWLENLNLRGGYKAEILDYIERKHPELLPLYKSIYNEGDCSYWENLDKDLRIYTSEKGLKYLINNDKIKQPFDAPPVIVNYFYHEIIRKSSRKGERHA